mmetsp:Transcript_115314/g.222294  ORF Transcript_115314/g.222294 Transcript_115314/m.222294 type:complete len:610 (-) Transcript_115314:86-1915(-)
MGNAPACCNSATLSGRRFQMSVVDGGDNKLRSTKDYKAEYIEGGKVGQGTKCFEVTQKQSNQVYVMRQFPVNTMPCKSADEVGRHCATLEGLDHPHLCKFVEGFQDKHDVILIYEKADPETLFEHVRKAGKLKEQDAADYVHQVTMALSLAHNQHIYHGRLCPSKIILSLPVEDDEEDENVQLKVCDMGQVFYVRPPPHEGAATAKSLNNERYCITPELAGGDLETKPEEHMYYPAGADKNDMWALGAIIYHLMSGTPPFAQCGDRNALLDTVQNEFISFNSKVWSKISSEARDAVEMLLKVNPSLRLSAHTFLRHPFIAIAKTSFPKKKMVNLLKNLKVNAQNCDFTRFVIRVIAEQLPADGKQAEAVEKAFRCLDKDGDGVISTEELLQGLEKYLMLSKEEQEELFHCIDRDGSGTLNVNEFISATMDQRRAKSAQMLWQAFNAFDKDRGGSIAFDEVDTLVMELEGALSSKDQVKELCEHIRNELSHVSHNETIDFDQFVYILQHNEPTTAGSMKMELYRMLWGTCHVDCYKVRHMNSKSWDLSRVAMAASSRSAYRKNRRNLTAKKGRLGGGGDKKSPREGGQSARGEKPRAGNAKSSSEPAEAG